MISRYVKMVSAAFAVVLSVALFCHAASPGVKSDKEMYQYGEAIKVTFSGATGLDSDWICIVPAGSPETEAGDYKYLPKGLASDTLTFDPPAPGKYEVRAFYNYHTTGYVVAARALFSVTGDDAYAKDMEQRMTRKLNSGDPLEANVPSGSGLVYIVREPWGMSAAVDLEVTCNNKPLIVLGNSDYYPFVVSAGEYRLKTGSLFQAGTKTAVAAGQTGEAALNVKAGYVYYLRAKVVPLAYYDNFLESISHQEGAEMIKTYKLGLRK